MSEESLIVKKSRFGSDYDETHESSYALVSSNYGGQLVERCNWKSRKSKLQNSTTVLSGHEGAIYSISFSPSGTSLLSSSQDGKIFLWEVQGECKNYNVLHGHKNAILEAKWLTDTYIVSASADKTVSLWDANNGTRIRKYIDHTAIVNCCSVCGPQSGSTVSADPYLFISGSDDCYLHVWDTRAKQSVTYIESDYPILSSCLSSDGLSAYIGSIDNTIYRWDLRMETADPQLSLTLGGHVDSVCGLSLSADNSYLLSNSFDGRLYQWDVRPFVPDENNRCVREFSQRIDGAAQRPYNQEKNLLRCSWSPDQEWVTCGASDRMVKVWNSTSAALQHYLPGHKGSVNDVVFHPTQPIIASCGTDKVIYLGELN